MQATRGKKRSNSRTFYRQNEMIYTARLVPFHVHQQFPCPAHNLQRFVQSDHRRSRCAEPEAMTYIIFLVQHIICTPRRFEQSDLIDHHHYRQNATTTTTSQSISLYSAYPVSQSLCSESNGQFQKLADITCSVQTRQH